MRHLLLAILAPSCLFGMQNTPTPLQALTKRVPTRILDTSNDPLKKNIKTIQSPEATKVLDRYYAKKQTELLSILNAKFRRGI